MPFKDETKLDRLVTYFLGGYAFMGTVMGVIYWWFEPADVSLLSYFFAYVLLPIVLVTVRIRRQNLPQFFDWFTSGYLALLVLRYVGPDAFWTWYPPITVSLPISSFNNGSGFLIDFIPLSLLALMFYQKRRS